MDFAGAARAGRRARRADRAPVRGRPAAVRRLVAAIRRAAAGDPAHASRARRLPRPHRGPSSAACRCSRARSTASTPSVEAAPSRRRTASVGRLADPHIAISHGLARYLAEAEGFAEDEFTVVHYGIEPGPEPAPSEPAAPPPALRREARPDQGPRRPAARPSRRRAARFPELELATGRVGPARDEHPAPCRGARPRRRGTLPRARLAGRAAASRRPAIVVVPSLGEGFGMVALEAMERGRAVIASDVGGLPEIVVDGETGLVVPPGDHDALAAAIVELAPTRRGRPRWAGPGRERAVEAFSQERCTERTAELYEAALVAPGSRSRDAGGALPGAFEREGREQREQEVPGDAVARASRRTPSPSRCCRRGASTSATNRRGARKRPASGEREERHHEDAARRCAAACRRTPAGPGRPSRP